MIDQIQNALKTANTYGFPLPKEQLRPSDVTPSPRDGSIHTIAAGEIIPVDIDFHENAKLPDAIRAVNQALVEKVQEGDSQAVVTFRIKGYSFCSTELAYALHRSFMDAKYNTAMSPVDSKGRQYEFLKIPDNPTNWVISIREPA